MQVAARRRLLLIAVLGALGVLVVAGGGWLLLRDSSFVAIDDVTITGATSSNAGQIRDALDTAARGMTTLHARADALKAAVAPYPSVANVRFTTKFPHTMTIQVVERAPVAEVADGSTRIPVTGGGVLLRGVQPPDRLPTIHVKGGVVGPRVTNARALGAIAVVAAAPAPLLRVSARVVTAGRGIVVDMRDGPQLVFGSRDDAAAKWAAAARVLAEPSAAGATYLDLRIPGRVGAGGLAPVTPQETDPNAQLQATTG